MKKALAILLALSMVFAAFADEPATNYSVAEFSGSASLEWVSDLDAKTNGFKNDASATLKINLLNGGEKVTAGDGVWGELKIKIDAQDALATPTDLKIEKTAAVDVAKIHFVDGDVGIALNIKPDMSLGLGEGCVTTATGYEVKNAGVNPNDALKTGFKLEVTTGVVDANFTVADNGVADKKEFGFAADATVKAVENMNIKAAFAYAAEKTAMRFGADYKLAINEKLYVKPAVDFTMMGEAKSLLAGAIFGWGAEGQKPEFTKLNKDSDKFADGISVAFTTDLADAKNIQIGLYDSTLLEGLKVGVNYDATLAEFAKGKINAGVKYGTDIDILTISAEFGYEQDLAAETNDYMYKAGLSTDDVIDNTSLYANYEGGKDKTGKITVGTKISL